MKINFGRSGVRNCPAVMARNEDVPTPWVPAMLSGADTTVFSAQIGPAGGSRGYTPITGR